MTLTKNQQKVVREDWWCQVPNLTDRIKQTVMDVQDGDTSTSGTSLRDELESFKNEVYNQLDAIREDIHSLQDAQQGKQ